MIQPTVVDLFSGCGGMSWGLEKSGFKTIAAIDNWTVALRTFAHNHPDALVVDDDIREVDASELMEKLGVEPGQLDVIVGGPPCQGFSKNVPASYRYLQDERNQLFRDYMRFVEAFMPKAIVMENVAELYNAYGGSVRTEITDWLHRLGYKTDVRVLTASDYGVPQKRRRCIFLASRVGHTPSIPIPDIGLFGGLAESIQSVSAWDAISDLPRLEMGEAFEPRRNPNQPSNDFQEWARQSTDVVHNHVAAQLKPTQVERYAALEPGQGIKDLPDHLRPKGGYSGAYGRLDFTRVAPTITRWVFHPGSGRYGHPRERRIITMREAARLQSFTDDFVFLGSKNDIAGQIGNAVPPRMMAALAEEVKRCIQPAGTPLEVQLAQVSVA